jgi:23S rRNA (guanine745-N1)-methyltransferase
MTALTGLPTELPANRWREGICCPLCRGQLYQLPGGWHCEQRHSFDTARQGYTHLLPVQHKKSKSPGDDAAMVAARTSFLNGHYYQAVSAQLNRSLTDYFNQQGIAEPRIVDAGCGEGYYTNRLMQELPAADITGLDISKQALLTAARRNRSVRWFVANSSHLPMADHSLDCILSLFSPLPVGEFSRALKPQGLLAVISTGAGHLLELRQLLYDEVKETALQPAATLAPYFTALAVNGAIPLSYRCELPNTETIINLLSMTPHYWRVSPERKEQLKDISRLTVTVDITLHLFQSAAR